MTDDQTNASFAPRPMPYAWRLFNGPRGAIFDQAIATPPLCCPARATFLTGQYPHKHGVLGNVPGYPDLRDKANLLPAWLGRAGYRTAFVGKFLNGYEQVVRPAPGWDSWHATFNYPNYFDYIVNDDRRLEHYGDRPGHYSTTQYTDRAVAEVEGLPSDGKPLFMWLAYNAPHVTAAADPSCPGLVPKPPDRKTFARFARDQLPRGPSFNETDRSDKPRAIADAPPLGKREIASITLRWRCTLASMRAVDDGIERLVAALEDSGELENSVLVFLSDNGFFFGEHAIGREKRLPYRASAQVPLAIRVGANIAGDVPARIDELVGTVDLAPTLLDFAGARPCTKPGRCRALDGRSLRPLIEGRGQQWPEDRALLLELDETYTYEALRTPSYLYSRTTADPGGALEPPALELYDLEADPHELDNLAGGQSRAANALAARLDSRLERLIAR